MTEINYEENKIISNEKEETGVVGGVLWLSCKVLALQACGPEFNFPEPKLKIKRQDVVVCTCNSRAGETEIGRHLKLTCQPA